MTTLFDLAQYEVIPAKREIDPYWDEVVLDCSGRVEDNGQTTLFYDASDEPPDPDDFQDRNDYEVVLSDWEKQHPDFEPAMSPWTEQDDGDFMDVLEEGLTLPEHPNNVLEKSKVNQWVESYCVSRGGNKYWYYRYCYYQKRIFHIHIPGGNTKSRKSLEIKSAVESAIADQRSPIEIQNLIRGGFQN